jgi:hypothetical protein
MLPTESQVNSLGFFGYRRILYHCVKFSKHILLTWLKSIFCIKKDKNFHATHKSSAMPGLAQERHPKRIAILK